MRVVLAVATLFLLAPILSGCTGSGGGDGSGDGDGRGRDGGIDDSKVPKGHVSATTGAVRGVVVDPAIVPVAGANVTLETATGKASQTSDAQGRFIFSDVAPGSHFLGVSHFLFQPYETTVDVVANVAEPPVVHVAMTPLYSQKPYSTQVSWEGFFECSQAGAGLYSSSNCVTDQCPIIMDASQCNQLPTSQMNNVTSQQREWHSDVGPGWKTLVFDVSWEDGGQFSTSQNMGIVVSTYKPERDPSHWFAQETGGSPITLRLENGTQHESASGVEPAVIPDEGMSRMSYFVSVREPDDPPLAPGLAVNQAFKVIHTQFYHAAPPEGWSATKDDRPF